GTTGQVNDLDLSVEVDGETYLGNQFDHQWSVPGGTADSADNYEAVFLPAGASGELLITVAGTNIAGDGVPNSGDATDQDFALVCTNCAELPTFSVTSTQPSLQLCAGREANVPVHVASIAGFVDPVTLSVSGLPSGASGTFAVNPATPPIDADLTLATSAST